MSWIVSPSVLHRAVAPGAEDSQAAYLIGKDEDSGLKCYYDDRFEKYVISDHISPVLSIDGAETVLRPAAFTYANHVVLQGGMYVFYSVSVGKFILKRQLTEPFFGQEGFDDTGNHKVGSDDFWYLSSEGLAPGDVEFTYFDDLSQKKYGTYGATYYEKVEDSFLNSHPFCGRYYSSDLNKYRTVGCQSFAVTRAPDELRTRDFVQNCERDAAGHYVYEGVGETIRFYGGAYCIRVPSTVEGAIWWEGPSQAPSGGVGNVRSIRFRAKTVRNGSVVSSSIGDVYLMYSGCSFGKKRAPAFVGDIEIWR